MIAFHEYESMAWSSEGIRLTLLLVLGLITRAVGEVVTYRDSEQDEASLWNIEAHPDGTCRIKHPGESNSILTFIRWDVSEFGRCSVNCGGGIQVRTVRCVRGSQIFGSDKEILCPQPAPLETQSCNSLECTAYWNISSWSECSATCGVGTLTREVTCQLIPLQGEHHQVDPAECGGLAPESTRKCYVTDCEDTSQTMSHSILSENYTLIQLRKTKQIKVTVGGQVYLLPGQTIVVACPVKNYFKHLVYWNKDYKLLPFTGRVHNKGRGFLYIEEGNPRTDAGVYTCNAGDQTANITVTFIQKDDPSAKVYKKWIYKSHKKNHKYKTYKKETSNMISATELNLEESNQQRDQSHNSSHSSLMYVTGNWSPCSAPCRAKGHRKRNVSCSHMTPKYVKIFPDSECQAIGLDKPETVEECSSTHKQCATWRPGPWSKCLPACGSTGHRTRLLTCVWETTGHPAGANCDLPSKPEVSKLCKTRPCPLECKDSSRYCGLSRLLKLCRFSHFKHECCLTCHRLSNTTLIQGQ